MAEYLYNDIKLPDINAVWTDKVTYPYAVIHSGDGTYILIISSSKIQYGTGSGNQTGSSSKNDGAIVFCRLKDGAWTIEIDNLKVRKNGFIYSTVDGRGAPILWANHDVTTIENGVPNDTIYLAASDPIYAGSTPGPDPEPEPDPDPFTHFSVDLYIKKGNKVYKVSGGIGGGDTTGL